MLNKSVVILLGSLLMITSNVFASNQSCRDTVGYKLSRMNMSEDLAQVAQSLCYVDPDKALECILNKVNAIDTSDDSKKESGAVAMLRSCFKEIAPASEDNQSTEEVEINQ